MACLGVSHHVGASLILLVGPASGVALLPSLLKRKEPTMYEHLRRDEFSSRIIATFVARVCWCVPRFCTITFRRCTAHHVLASLETFRTCGSPFYLATETPVNQRDLVHALRATAVSLRQGCWSSVRSCRLAIQQVGNACHAHVKHSRVWRVGLPWL